MHLFEYLNEVFLEICSPFEGGFHSIDFSFSTWTLRGRRPVQGALVQEVAGRQLLLLKKKCLDAVHDRPPTL